MRLKKPNTRTKTKLSEPHSEKSIAWLFAQLCKELSVPAGTTQDQKPVLDYKGLDERGLVNVYKNRFISELPQKDFKAEAFDLTKPAGSQIAKAAEEHFLAPVLEQLEKEKPGLVDDFLRARLKKYINNRLKINFLRLLDENILSLKKLNDFFDSKAYPAELEAFRKERYRFGLEKNVHPRTGF